MVNHPSEIPITEEDLRHIVQDEFPIILSLALHHAYCGTCFGQHEVEMVDYQIKLNDLNDVLFQGTCNTCGGRMARYVETGERESFARRAEAVKAAQRGKG